MELKRKQWGGVSGCKTRNDNIDLLKLLACVAVIGLHTLRKDISPFNQGLYSLCGFAIPVFFMSSGYILLNRPVVSFDYIAHKIAGILRIVLCWNGIIFVLMLGARLALHKDMSRYSPLSFFEQIAQGFVQKGDMWQLWYMGALLLVYCLLPVLQRVTRRGQRAQRCAWAQFAFISLGIQMGSMIAGKPLAKWVIQTFRLWTWIQYFLLGGGMAALVPKFKEGLKLGTHGICLACWTMAAVAWQGFAGVHFIHDTHAEYFYDSFITIVWCALLFAFVLRIDMKPAVVKAVRQYGPLVLGVYIVHPYVVSGLAKVFPAKTPLFAIGGFFLVVTITFAGIRVLSRVRGARYLLKI